MKKIILSLFFCDLALFIMAAEPDSLTRGKLTISGELRPRLEIRNGYRTLLADSLVPASFVSQRSRLNFDFRNHYLTFYFSLQDVRIWGADASTSDKVFPGIFESWAELRLAEKWKMRAGRQALTYDNERLFSVNNWKQSGRTHDALRFAFCGKNLTMEQVLGFSQTKENSSGTEYKPGFSNYKFLAMNYMKYKLSSTLSLTSLQTADGFQDAFRAENMYMRYTTGGRVEYKTEKMMATGAGWYQWGHTDSTYKIRAWYAHSEIRYQVGRDISATAGAEIVSGNLKNQPVRISRAFIPLYGSGHTFMGYMDYFTAFPGDTKNEGLINPYLLIQYKLNKLCLKLHNHLFYLQGNSTDLTPYLGYETDLVVQYKLNDFATFDYGFCTLSPSESMNRIKNVEKPAPFQFFSYIMLTVKPVLFSSQK